MSYILICLIDLFISTKNRIYARAAIQNLKLLVI